MNETYYLFGSTHTINSFKQHGTEIIKQKKFSDFKTLKITSHSNLNEIILMATKYEKALEVSFLQFLVLNSFMGKFSDNLEIKRFKAQLYLNGINSLPPIFKMFVD